LDWRTKEGYHFKNSKVNLKQGRIGELGISEGKKVPGEVPFGLIWPGLPNLRIGGSLRMDCFLLSGGREEFD